MKFITALLFIPLAATLSAAEAPEFLTGLLKPGVPKKGQIGVILTPPEMDKYVAKVESASRKNLEWFREYSREAKPGLPLPYDDRLGLTKEEYEDYLGLWAKREFKSTEDVTLLLREGTDGSWVITGTGKASTLSTLRYFPKEDVFRSPNGEMTRIPDIKSDPQSILGAWGGREWRFEEETSLGKTKENIAVGSYVDGTHGLIVHRLQELTTGGTRLLDKSIVIRFQLDKRVTVKGSKPTDQKPKTKKP